MSKWLRQLRIVSLSAIALCTAASVGLPVQAQPAPGATDSMQMAMPAGQPQQSPAFQPASSNQPPAGGKFLQAQISHTDAMSRAELSAGTQDQISLAIPLLPQAPMPAAQPVLQANAQSGVYNLQSDANQSDMAQDVRKREYNVDWASWLAKVADRWFFILDQYERQTRTHYVTQQPALFRFTCYNNGQIANVTMKQSSGNVAYDRLQMVALMQSMPVPPFPMGTQRQSITLVQGWESHVRQAGESDYIPGSFGRGFPMEKVTQWYKVR